MWRLPQFEYLAEEPNILWRRFLLIVLFPFLVLDSIAWSFKTGTDLPVPRHIYIWYGIFSDIRIGWHGYSYFDERDFNE